MSLDSSQQCFLKTKFDGFFNLFNVFVYKLTLYVEKEPGNAL